MLTAKAKQQEGELSQLSQLQAYCTELQREMEAERAASQEYHRETQVHMCVHIPDTDIRIYVCTYVQTLIVVCYKYIGTYNVCEVCTYICKTECLLNNVCIHWVLLCWTVLQSSLCVNKMNEINASYHMATSGKFLTCGQGHKVLKVMN